MVLTAESAENAEKQLCDPGVLCGEIFKEKYVRHHHPWPWSRQPGAAYP
jgi:hypothetical protein